MDFSATILHWFWENRRDLPWRKTSDPYKIWLSEIILQQTRVAQGLPYYERFLERFPGVADLANASEEDVLKLWQGLGYYSRARNLHAAAKIIHRQYGDKFPRDYHAVRALPGVGDYTAAAVVSFAFNLPYPVIDGNVIRFISRLDGIAEEAGSPACKKEILRSLNKRMDKTQAGAFNQALMEFGALVCTPGQAACQNGNGCPFSTQCHAYKNDVVNLFPVKKEKKPLKRLSLHYLWLCEGEYAWVHKRGYDDLWRGMFDLPIAEDVLENAGNADDARVSTVCETDTDLEFMKEYRQTLTHRLLSVRFYRVKPGGLTAKKIKGGPQWQKKYKKDLSQLAVPKIISDFFCDFNIF